MNHEDFQLDRGQRRRLKLEQAEAKQARRLLLQARSRLGRFKGRQRSADDRAERTRLDAALRAADAELEFNRVLLRRPTDGKRRRAGDGYLKSEKGKEGKKP